MQPEREGRNCATKGKNSKSGNRANNVNKSGDNSVENRSKEDDTKTKLVRMNEVTDELKRRLNRLEEKEKEREVIETTKEENLSAMSSLLYRLDDKSQENETNLEILAGNVAAEMEITKGAMRIITQKLNEVAVFAGLESVAELVGVEEADKDMEEFSSDEDETIGGLTEEEQKKKDTEQKTMPADKLTSLRGMGDG